MRLAPEHSNIDVQEYEEFLQDVLQYMYPIVIQSKFVDMETGDINVPEHIQRRELQILNKCAKLRGIEINFTEEFQNTILISHFGMLPMEDKGFWGFWEDMDTKQRAYIIRELNEWNKKPRGIPLKDLPTSEVWFQFRQYIYSLLQDE